MKKSVQRDATRLSIGVVLRCWDRFWFNHAQGEILSLVPRTPSLSRSVVFAADAKPRTTLAPSPTPKADLKAAIRTTVWAIKNKRTKARGPTLRTTQGRSDATGPAPSWY